MKNLLIIGSGGCGREVLQWARDINAVQKKWNIKGFLDYDPDGLQGKDCSLKILSDEDVYKIGPDDEFICCIGNSKRRRSVIEKMKARGAVIATIIHPTSVIADTCRIGEGVIIYPYALISDNAVIGDGCIINMYTSVAHDSSLGSYCTISAHCDITGMCTLGQNVFMGSASNMVPGTVVGDDAYICAGSVVMARVRKGRKVLGNPAKIVNF